MTVHRHDVAEIAGIAAFSFGEEEIDRAVTLYKKEFAPCDEELAALRRGDEWDPVKAQAEAERVIMLSLETDFALCCVTNNCQLTFQSCYLPERKRVKRREGSQSQKKIRCSTCH